MGMEQAPKVKIGSAVQAWDDDLDDLAGITGARGEIIFRDATEWAALGVGTAGQVLQTNGAGADPTWVAAAGAGTATIWAHDYTSLPSFSDLFDDSSLDAAWLELDASGLVTLSEDSKRAKIVLDGSSGGSVHVGGMVQLAPTASPDYDTYNITARVYPDETSIDGTVAGDDFYCGILLMEARTGVTDTTSGIAAIFSITDPVTSSWKDVHMIAVHYSNGSTSGGTTDEWGTSGGYPDLIRAHVDRSGSNVQFLASYDNGKSWIAQTNVLTWASVGLTAVSHIGIGGQNRDAAGGQDFTIRSDLFWVDAGGLPFDQFGAEITV